MTGTTVLPFNPAAFGEVGLQCLYVMAMKTNIIPKLFMILLLYSKLLLCYHCSFRVFVLRNQIQYLVICIVLIHS